MVIFIEIFFMSRTRDPRTAWCETLFTLTYQHALSGAWISEPNRFFFIELVDLKLFSEKEMSFRKKSKKIVVWRKKFTVCWNFEPPTLYAVRDIGVIIRFLTKLHGYEIFAKLKNFRFSRNKVWNPPFDSNGIYVLLIGIRRSYA